MVSSVEILTRAVFGTMARPVRSAANLLVNAPDGFPSAFPPVAWSGDALAPGAWWVGASQSDGTEPIGPNGPWTAGGRLPSAAERATGLVVGPLASVLPWRVYRGSWRGDSDAEALEPRLWMSDPQLVGNVTGVGRSLIPAPARKPGVALWSEWLRHALWFGKGWLTFAEAGDPGREAPFTEPVAGSVMVLSPAMVEQLDDGSGWRIGDWDTFVDTDGDGRYRMGGRGWRLVCLWEPNGDGTGVFGRHAAELGLAVQVRSYASGTFRSGVPAGYLKTTQPGLTQEQADKLKASWMKAHGVDRRSIAVLNATTDFQPVNISPVDAQLAQTDDMVLRMLAHAFNLSSRALDSGASSGMTYANIQDERRDRIDDTVMPWKRAVEDTLSGLLPYGSWLELETRGYLESDPQKRTDYYGAGIGQGWLFPDEVRPLERLPKRDIPPAAPAAPMSPQLVAEEVPADAVPNVQP